MRDLDRVLIRRDKIDLRRDIGLMRERERVMRERVVKLALRKKMESCRENDNVTCLSLD